MRQVRMAPESPREGTFFLLAPGSEIKNGPFEKMPPGIVRGRLRDAGNYDPRSAVDASASEYHCHFGR